MSDDHLPHRPHPHCLFCLEKESICKLSLREWVDEYKFLCGLLAAVAPTPTHGDDDEDGLPMCPACYTLMKKLSSLRRKLIQLTKDITAIKEQFKDKIIDSEKSSASTSSSSTQVKRQATHIEERLRRSVLLSSGVDLDGNNANSSTAGGSDDADGDVDMKLTISPRVVLSLLPQSVCGGLNLNSWESDSSTDTPRRLRPRSHRSGRITRANINILSSLPSPSSVQEEGHNGGKNGDERNQRDPDPDPSSLVSVKVEAELDWVGMGLEIPGDSPRRNTTTEVKANSNDGDALFSDDGDGGDFSPGPGPGDSDDGEGDDVDAGDEDYFLPNPDIQSDLSSSSGDDDDDDSHNVDLDPDWAAPASAAVTKTSYKPGPKCKKAELKITKAAAPASGSRSRRNNKTKTVRPKKAGVETKRKPRGHRPTSGSTSFSCPHCSLTAGSRSALKVHIRTHTGEKLYKCQHCQYAGITKRHLKLHVTAIHSKQSEDKPFLCEICSMTFRLKTYLQNHMRVHTKDKNFLCHLCPFSSIHHGALKNHILGVHEKFAKFSCYFCKKPAKNFSNLNKHLRIHTGETPFKCPQCPFQTPNESNIKTHMKVHKNQGHGEGPGPQLEGSGSIPTAGSGGGGGGGGYSCTECPLTFNSNRSLLTHTRTHSEFLKCKVPNCTFQTIASFQLKQHIEECHPKGELNYSCPHCPKRFLQLYSFQRHISSRLCPGSRNCVLNPQHEDMQIVQNQNLPQNKSQGQNSPLNYSQVPHSQGHLGLGIGLGGRGTDTDAFLEAVLNAHAPTPVTSGSGHHAHTQLTQFHSQLQQLQQFSQYQNQNQYEQHGQTPSLIGIQPQHFQSQSQNQNQNYPTTTTTTNLHWL